VLRTYRPVLLAALSCGLLSCGDYPTGAPDRQPVRLEETPYEDPTPRSALRTSVESFWTGSGISYWRESLTISAESMRSVTI
jgi:hypothetical protein